MAFPQSLKRNDSELQNTAYFVCPQDTQGELLPFLTPFGGLNDLFLSCFPLVNHLLWPEHRSLPASHRAISEYLGDPWL